ncbi:SMI1/KNR4 family protein [Streptomyces sp. NBC_01012]|uniref:SMI1/KNR4 family protein n=1 Tax=Streptomyces sp. NBC_01012 TaxID=2903717 RepID=UPI003865300B|nr:SMI1/KNR4 family protein [Streptomyces sp. NBC_01012]
MNDDMGRTDRDFPAALAEVAGVDFHDDRYLTADAGGYEYLRFDFEPSADFESAEWTTDLFRNWTGNPEVDGDAYLVFGQDGSGGKAMIWRVRPDRPLADQPIVFLGSEGERGVVAGSLSDFLWVLADGYGPMEAAEAGADDFASEPDELLTRIAERHATTPRRTAKEIVTEARAEFPAFSDDIDALCR